MKTKTRAAARAGGKDNTPSGRYFREKPSAYGETRPICMNAGCVLRKKAKCFGFEGCPGFKGA